MICHAMREVGPNVHDAGSFDEKLAELIHAREKVADFRDQALVAAERRHLRVEVAHHADTRGRRRDNHLSIAEDLDEVTDQWDRLTLVASIVVHLSAAGLS